ncbi:MAG: hypothetical protein ACW986_10410 [Promethearchaeota archaeon]|jgi:tRNA A-37 threonylcarbamoyl transferase component Bud32
MTLQTFKHKITKDLKGVIPELRSSSVNFQITELPSKKNTVFNIVFDTKPQEFPKEFILKVFKTKNIVSENNILIRLKNQHFHVPTVLKLKKPYLLLEKVKGITLCDFINDSLQNTSRLEDLDSKLKTQIVYSIEKLAEWLAQLHEKNIVRKRFSDKIYVLNKGDTRLRDFVMDFPNDVLYGVDFEDSYEGNHIDDLAWICCSLLDTSPGLFDMDEPKHKIDLINLFLKYYYQISSSVHFDFNYLAEKIIENLNIVIERRNLPFGRIGKTAFIEDISKEL